MLEPSVPKDEEQRLGTLESLGLLYSPAEKRFDRITQVAQELFGVPIALVSLVGERCQWFKSAQGLNAAETPREISFCGHAIFEEDTLVVSDTLEDPIFADNPLVTGYPNIRFYAGQPIFYKGDVLGTLCVIDKVPRVFDDSQIESLKSLAGWVENEIQVSALSESQNELIAELDSARRKSMIDPLTGLWNRRGLNEIIPREIAHAADQETAVSLLMVDVDDFKSINDLHGHEIGDMLLKAIAAKLRSTLRPDDVVCRFAGDEFLVLLKGCRLEGARASTQRLLDGMPQCTDEAGLDNSITAKVSIGAVSVEKVFQDSYKTLLRAADEALYNAKAQGKGCVVHAELMLSSLNVA